MKNEYNFELSQHELQSFLWTKIQKHFQYILDRERNRNDYKQDADDTASTRGKISLCKELIALNEKEEVIEEEQ